MSTAPVTLDFSKAQPVSGGVQLDFSKAQPVDQAPAKQYLPGRQFGMDVARGMGLDRENCRSTVVSFRRSRIGRAHTGSGFDSGLGSGRCGGEYFTR